MKINIIHRGGVFDFPIFFFNCIRKGRRCANFAGEIGKVIGRDP